MKLAPTWGQLRNRCAQHSAVFVGRWEPVVPSARLPVGCGHFRCTSRLDACVFLPACDMPRLHETHASHFRAVCHTCLHTCLAALLPATLHSIYVGQRTEACMHMPFLGPSLTVLALP